MIRRVPLPEVKYRDRKLSLRHNPNITRLFQVQGNLSIAFFAVELFLKSNFSPQSQVLYFDVSQPLEEIQARDSVKWTPIALVKQDSVFLPGTTIGATHWVAYAMTRGKSHPCVSR